MSREDVGVITISQDLNTLGLIESANAIALSIFGYNKRDVVGRNISIIVPAPMSGSHQTYLRQYVESGKTTVCDHASNYLLLPLVPPPFPTSLGVPTPHT